MLNQLKQLLNTMSPKQAVAALTASQLLIHSVFVGVHANTLAKLQPQTLDKRNGNTEDALRKELERKQAHQNREAITSFVL